MSPVLEYDESRGKPEIVDRLILRDPTENEFILTICLMIAVGTSTEKIVIKLITSVIAKKLDVDFNSDTKEFRRVDYHLPPRGDRRETYREHDERESLVDNEEGP